MKGFSVILVLLLAIACLYSCGEGSSSESRDSFWEQFDVIAWREILSIM